MPAAPRMIGGIDGPEGGFDGPEGPARRPRGPNRRSGAAGAAKEEFEDEATWLKQNGR